MNINVTRTMANARSVMSEGAFQQAGTALSDAMNIVREAAQQKTSSELKEIIEKLQSGLPITTEEVALIKSWIVGDAISYTESENNFEDWLVEYERLEKSLADYENKNCSPEELIDLHGILEDASRISYDFANYLEKKARIRKFESAVASGLDKEGRDILTEMLNEKLQSPDF